MKGSLASVILNLEIMELLISIVVILDIIVRNEFDYLYSMKAVHDTAVSRVRSIDFGITDLLDG
jgi:hypothetical protein